MNRQDIPNIISGLRVILAIPVVWLLVTEEYGFALLLFAVAGLSDGLDGFLAKRYGWESRLGKILDPLADKALLVSSYLVLGWQGLVPLWLMLAIIFRDVIIVAGAILYHRRFAGLDAAKPSPMSKFNTLVQIILVILIVVDRAAYPMPYIVLEGLTWIVLASTVLSGAGYVWDWGRRAVNQGIKSR